MTAAASSWKPLASTSKLPARLPLSTIDTYRGCNGASERVSYQLKKCPWCRSMPESVSNVRCVRISSCPTEQ